MGGIVVGSMGDDLPEEVKKDLPEDALTWEALDEKYGVTEGESVPVIPEVFQLTTGDIACLAYTSMASYLNLLIPQEEQKPWDQLSAEEQFDYTDMATGALQSHADPSDENFARLIHSKRALRLLIKGVKFSEERDDNEESWKVAPWETQPHERRIPLL